MGSVNMSFPIAEFVSHFKKFIHRTYGILTMLIIPPRNPLAAAIANIAAANDTHANAAKRYYISLPTIAAGADSNTADAANTAIAFASMHLRLEQKSPPLVSSPTSQPPPKPPSPTPTKPTALPTSPRYAAFANQAGLVAVAATAVKIAAAAAEEAAYAAYYATINSRIGSGKDKPLVNTLLKKKKIQV